MRQRSIALPIDIRERACINATNVPVSVFQTDNKALARYPFSERTDCVEKADNPLTV
jgi:hypothetical protein